MDVVILVFLQSSLRFLFPVKGELAFLKYCLTYVGFCVCTGVCVHVCGWVSVMDKMENKDNNIHKTKLNKANNQTNVESTETKYYFKVQTKVVHKYTT